MYSSISLACVQLPEQPLCHSFLHWQHSARQSPLSTLSGHCPGEV
jgi:hypothetical protein